MQPNWPYFPIRSEGNLSGAGILIVFFCKLNEQPLSQQVDTTELLYCVSDAIELFLFVSWLFA